MVLSNELAQYDIASGLEDNIGLTVRVDHPKSVGIVLAKTCRNLATNVLHSDR